MNREDEADYRRKIALEAFAAGVAYASRFDADPATMQRILDIVGNEASTHNRELFAALAEPDEKKRNAHAREWRQRHHVPSDTPSLLDAILDRLRVFSLSELNRRYAAIAARWRLPGLDEEYHQQKHAEFIAAIRRIKDA